MLLIITILNSSLSLIKFSEAQIIQWPVPLISQIFSPIHNPHKHRDNQTILARKIGFEGTMGNDHVILRDAVIVAARRVFGSNAIPGEG